ncbi:MAG: hypothetical protein ACPG80_05035, partial [Rickettsiales bacterium]
MLSADTLITLLQALQLVALVPCLFVILFLCLSNRSAQAVVPVFYFLAMVAAFVLPLLEVWPEWDTHSRFGRQLYGGLLFIQSLIPAFTFLLVLQFMLGRVPPPPYWLILALPLFGGSHMVYAALMVREICIDELGCLPSTAAQSLYAMFGTALMFLLLVVEFMRLRTRINRKDKHWSSKYWLMIALIGTNLFLLALDLLHLAGEIRQTDVLFAATMVRVT